MATTRTKLKLLGGFDLFCAGRPVPVQWSAQRLLVFVALHEEPLLRPYVAGSLWLDSTEERANANLRSALWRLHRCGHALMECAGQRLALGRDVVVDLRESEKVARRVLAGSSDDDLDVGPVALHGDLLPGWYDDWIIFERERYRQLRLRALDRLCERLTAAGRLDEALAAGLAAVKLEPLRESSHRAVVRAHIVDGNVAEAVRQYRICRRILHDQLGLEPSAQMDGLLEGVHALATAR